MTTLNKLLLTTALLTTFASATTIQTTCKKIDGKHQKIELQGKTFPSCFTINLDNVSKSDRSILLQGVREKPELFDDITVK